MFTELTTDTFCGRTLIERGRGKSFMDGAEGEWIAMRRCEREPGHEGEHFGPHVETNGDWATWEGR